MDRPARSCWSQLYPDSRTAGTPVVVLFMDVIFLCEATGGEPVNSLLGNGLVVQDPSGRRVTGIRGLTCGVVVAGADRPMNLLREPDVRARRRRRWLVALVGVCLMPFMTACANEDRPGPSSVTEAQAREVLKNVSSDIAENSTEHFCEKSTVQVETCEDALDEARAQCLSPGSAPRVVNSARVPRKPGIDGGWVLAVEGRTDGGQQYASHFFVTAPKGIPRASIGIYWTGIGLGDRPFDKWRNCPSSVRVPEGSSGVA